MYATVCKTHFPIFISVFIFSISAFAETGHPYIGTSIASSYAHLSNKTPVITYHSGGLITDTYPLHHQRASSGVMSLNGGYEFVGSGLKPAIALGIGAYNTPVGFNYHGSVFETAEGDPTSLLYRYRYNVNTTRLMTEVQFKWMREVFSPFVSMGIGAAWNKMNDYEEMAVESTGYSALPDFQTHTNTTFAYQAGLGFSTAFNFETTHSDFLHERISLGYQYVNLGSTEFAARSSDYPYELKTGRLMTNDVYLSYTHLF